MFSRSPKKKSGDQCAIFVHAGAGFHSHQNEHIHLQVCSDAARAGMAALRAGGTAIDAVELSIKVLEDREITNAGYGSNLAMDGTVECDATVVDHYGRSGAVGAVSQIRNPISLARVILDHSNQPMSLRRVPPNLLVGQGAVDFAFDQGVPILPHDALVSPAARERWMKWRKDLKNFYDKNNEEEEMDMGDQDVYIDDDYEEHVRRAQRRQHTRALMAGVWNDSQPYSPQPTPPIASAPRSPTPRSPQSPESPNFIDPGPHMADGKLFQREGFSRLRHNSIVKQHSPSPQQDAARDSNSDEDLIVLDDDNLQWKSMEQGNVDGHSESEVESMSSGSIPLPSASPSPPPFAALHTPLPPSPTFERSDTPSVEGNLRDDFVTDTVGAIAIDSQGNIAAGSSSGGIGMKLRGRCGPAALVGIGTAVVPVSPDDKNKTCVAAITSGTGEHMATTMAAGVCAERLYSSVRKRKAGGLEEVDEEIAIRAVIEQDFMQHPSVRHSHSPGAIGLLAVKKSRDGTYLYFAHNTDSFAVASMGPDDVKPSCAMSRNSGNGSIAQGARSVTPRRKR
ncbi:N-terminal nucleophile aminohydrolase [Xylona heveae TC161]|uniref:N-terminal nucleophile aminohydrolase n=1 Tax=Xylona heveae (strain CBS 132557 / TC161) TaxID=1328760 RepID=A0A164ZTJ8_XYLHT|nr:N-terminal nucleophile aminohydrolase [Xylona heveae TC161]KZF19494.1 N-terminal nucleophile aminohydrolase [Xylona heveae TC161]